MIMIHELGHYLAGKLLKFKIEEFSIGFGKALFSKTMKSGETFSIRLIPLGGYCAFKGEDEDGNVYATRIGTTRQRFVKDQLEWVNDYMIPIHYGDITKRPDFKTYQGLFPDGGEFYCENSKGKMVKIKELGWGNGNEQPTHIIMMITAGCYPAFYGHVGNALWVDNVRFVYE